MTANVFIPWSDEEREQLRRLHENGLSRNQIAAHMGRSKNSVSRQIARLGLLTNEPGAVKAVRKAAVAKPTARPVGHPRAPRTTLPLLPSLRVDD